MLGISHAGTNTFYFNSPDSTNGFIIFQAPAGGGYLYPSGGSPNDPAAADPSTNGYFAITDAVGSQRSVVIFPDFDSGLVVKGFQ